MVYSVSEITSKIKEIFETTFGTLTVEGEISNCRPSSSGHLYFTLKEKIHNSEVALSAVMFRSAAYRLKFKPTDGLKVQATGNISIYAERGTYQIIVQRLELAGEGEILKMLEERKRRLEAEGLFSLPRKPLPAFVTKIAVITSPTGAAVQDIVKIACKRNPKIQINVLPATVQGEKAASSLIEQLRNANRFNLGQVIIIGRGGGALEDLLPFSDEDLVREIAASKIPVVSAVGHEIDVSLSDYVADARAATPSEASEIVVPLLSDLVLDIQSYKQEICNNINLRIERIKLMIESLSKENLDLKFKSISQPFLLRLDDCKQALKVGIKEIIRDRKHKLEIYKQGLHLSNPKAILARGFSIVKKADGSILRESTNLKLGETVEITPSKGKFSASVTDIG
ncbi:MAG: exodeoxyribonuclease VII large subunit [Treponemataceae bacterium]